MCDMTNRANVLRGLTRDNLRRQRIDLLKVQLFQRLLRQMTLLGQLSDLILYDLLFHFLELL